MNTQDLPATAARLTGLAAAFVLVGLPLLAGAPATASDKAVTPNDAALGEMCAQRAEMFAPPAPVHKVARKDARADAKAAVAAMPRLHLDDAARDPLAAERAGLWDVAVPAGKVRR